MARMFERLARTHAAIQIALALTLSTTVLVFFLLGAPEAAFVTLLCLAGIPIYSRQLAARRRGMAVLNRYAAGRNARPLGL